MSELNVDLERDALTGGEADLTRPSQRPLSGACVCLRTGRGHLHPSDRLRRRRAGDRREPRSRRSPGRLPDVGFPAGLRRFQVPGGLLGDRLGGRRVLTILVLGWSLLTGAVALAALLPPAADAAVRLPAGAAVPLRHVPGRRVPHAGTRDRRLDAAHRARQRPGSDLDVQPMGRRTDSVSSGLALPRLWRLADPVPADRRAWAALVRRILAVVPRPPRTNAAGQSRRAENHRGRSHETSRRRRPRALGEDGPARSASGHCA